LLAQGGRALGQNRTGGQGYGSQPEGQTSGVDG
ncbi:MAG: hypothetical protein RLZZ268_1499, partial [Cyanobacteriota bacterium]